MCAPYHSIVQFPDNDPIVGGTGGMLDAIVGGFAGLKKHILNWFHLSKLGDGHSEAISAQNARGQLRLDRLASTDYEGAWWDRTFKIDGIYRGPSDVERDAYDAAKYYCEIVCMGNMRTFRNFLETSLKNTRRPSLFVQHFVEDMLNKHGRDEYLRKMKSAGFLGFKDIQSNPNVINALVGLTRKRKLFQDHWSGPELWLPRKESASLIVC